MRAPKYLKFSAFDVALEKIRGWIGRDVVVQRDAFHFDRTGARGADDVPKSAIRRNSGIGAQERYRLLPRPHGFLHDGDLRKVVARDVLAKAPGHFRIGFK